jgi:hypothetical protein
LVGLLQKRSIQGLERESISLEERVADPSSFKSGLFHMVS